MTWKKAIPVTQLAPGQGGCVIIDNLEIALFHYENNQWFAVQHHCPHTDQGVIARGLMGDKEGEPKVICPMHKRQYSLRTGRNLENEVEHSLQTFPVKIEGDSVFIEISSK